MTSKRADARRSAAIKWEVDRAIELAELRRADDKRRERDRQRLRDQALASARRHGDDERWRAYWLIVGLSECELSAIRVEITLGGST